MLLPHPTVASVADAYGSPSRPRPDHRPWILMSMIASADGATSLDGSSSSLGGPADREVFMFLHRLGDSVLVGAETVRADSYSPLPSGQRLVVVSSSGDLGGNGAALVDAPNTVVESGDVRDIVSRLPGDLCVLEGGPSLNGQMLAADLVDEVCLTIAPRFLAGRSDRVAEGIWAMREPWHLAHVGEEDGFLFLRYLRAPETRE